MINGFIDLQVNGYAGIDFNQNDLAAEDMHKACAKLKEDGVKGILATIITASIKDMSIRLRRIAELREQDPLVKEMILGIHIEGPFLSLSPGFRGAHPEAHICPASVDTMKLLLDAADGLTRIVTLAPEADVNYHVIRMLARDGITVSAGHCDTSLNELKAAIDAGLTMYTHLGNGCPEVLHRHDNIIQRVLSLGNQLWLCFIADGIHIPFYVLRNYLDQVGFEKSIIVTDAMAGAGAVPGKYWISNMQLEVGADRIVREPGKTSFAGSAIEMSRSYKNLITEIGLSEASAQRLTNENPIKSIQGL
ncbi:MAG: N-acetylglucosamine-6-phosphate deacetylase [Bacteroidota bacterium]